MKVIKAEIYKTIIYSSFLGQLRPSNFTSIEPLNAGKGCRKLRHVWFQAVNLYNHKIQYEGYRILRHGLDNG